MINNDKWIGSLPKINLGSRDKKNQIDHERWINTIQKKSTNHSMQKYSLVVVLFFCGLLFVSALKNETRNLQKEINNLQASIDVIKFNLGQAILDNEVLTSPENISLLAKEYLNLNLVSYKRSQINQLSSKNQMKLINDDTKKFTDINKIKKEEINEKNIKKLPNNIKSKISKKIEAKKVEIKKLQKLYRNPKLIPNEVRIKVVKTIKKKKSELENIYKEPRNIITYERIGKWGAMQVVKLFFGMPVIPGK